MSVSNPRESGGTKPYFDNYSKLTLARLMPTFPSKHPRQATTLKHSLFLLSIRSNPHNEEGKKNSISSSFNSLTNLPPNRILLGVPLYLGARSNLVDFLGEFLVEESDIHLGFQG